MSRSWRSFAAFLLAAVVADAAHAGPPYVTDDPVPTDKGHYEIYTFAAGTVADDGTTRSAGLDFNYGAAEDLQITLGLPIEHEDHATGLGNVELAAKYRVLHQEGFGLDVAVFPRVFLPSASKRVGDQHASVLLPIWVGRTWGKWNTFGGGGCVLQSGGGSRNFCLVGWAITREVLPGLEVGGEVFHRGADTVGGKPTTALGFGAQYALNEHLHILGSIGPGIENAATNQYSWYASLLIAF